jgi:hypothetical protein
MQFDLLFQEVSAEFCLMHALGNLLVVVDDKVDLD